jgi:hypothetical protein
MTSKVNYSQRELANKKETLDVKSTLFTPSLPIQKKQNIEKIQKMCKLDLRVPLKQNFRISTDESAIKAETIRKILTTNIATVKKINNVISLFSGDKVRRLDAILDQIIRLEAREGKKNICEEIKEELNEMKKREQLVSLAKMSIKRFMSKETGAYIHYIKELGSSGLYAASASENLAEKEILGKIKTEIMNANAEAMVFMENYFSIENKKSEMLQDIENIKIKSCNGSVGLYTSRMLKDKVQRMASLTGGSVNDFACRLTKLALDDIEHNVIHSNKHYAHEILFDSEQESEPSEDKVKWVVRCDRPTHARIIYIAQREGVSSAKVLVQILSRYIDK